MTKQITNENNILDINQLEQVSGGVDLKVIMTDMYRNGQIGAIKQYLGAMSDGSITYDECVSAGVSESILSNRGFEKGMVVTVSKDQLEDLWNYFGFH